MKQVSLGGLRKLAENSRPAVQAAAESCGRLPKIYLHWSAGHYGQFYDDYHINIDADGSIYISSDDLSEVLNHTWKRNRGAIGVALACCAGATAADLGEEPPTAEQIDSMAQVVMVVCDVLGLPIDKEHVLTHGEAADNEDGLQVHEQYGPKSTVERWDLEYLGTSESPVYNPQAADGSRGGDVIRGKAQWYRQQ